MKVIVVTGGIGSGKSALCRLLESKGYPVYDSDSRAKAMYGIYPYLKEYLKPDIFADVAALKKLEDALYPLLMDDFRQWAEAQAAEYVIFESAIVLQKQFFDNFWDYVLLVDAPEELRFKRAVRRGGRADDIRRRMALQQDQRHNPRVDFIIENNSSIKELEEQVETILKKIKDYGN